MKTDKILSIRKVASKSQFIITTYGGVQLWCSYGAFKNATGSLDYQQFNNGTISYRFLEVGEILADGKPVTDGGKLLDQLSLVIVADADITARKAAFIELEEQKSMNQEIARKRAMRNAMAAAVEAEAEEGDETPASEVPEEAVAGGEGSAFAD